MDNITTQINFNFLIRISTEGIKGTSLIGVNKFKNLFNTEKKQIVF